MSSDLKQSKDYSQFKKLPGNRPVCQATVNDLKESIRSRNKLHLHPIIIDKDGYIIDGQHRLEAAKALKVPFWYMIDNESHVNDIIILNTHRKNWSLQDYINYYHQEGRESYTFFSKMIDFAKECNAPFTAAYVSVRILSGSGNGNFATFLRSGVMHLIRRDESEIFIKKTFPLCKEINSLLKTFTPKSSTILFFKAPYISTLAYCFKIMSDKQYDELWNCIKRDYKAYTNTNSLAEVADHFEQSYNHKKGIAKFDFSRLHSSLANEKKS